MMFKNGSADLTHEELCALPAFDPFETEFTPHTEEDYMNGAVGKGRMVVKAKLIQPLYHDPKDTMVFWDNDDLAWTIVRVGRGGIMHKKRAPEFG